MAGSRTTLYAGSGEYPSGLRAVELTDGSLPGKRNAPDIVVPGKASGNPDAAPGPGREAMSVF